LNLFNHDDKRIVDEIVGEAVKFSMLRNQGTEIGIGAFPVLQIQATDSSLGPGASCPDLPEIVIIPEENVAMQVIHIVFRLMITKQNICSAATGISRCTSIQNRYVLKPV